MIITESYLKKVIAEELEGMLEEGAYEEFRDAIKRGAQKAGKAARNTAIGAAAGLGALGAGALGANMQNTQQSAQVQQQPINLQTLAADMDQVRGNDFFSKTFLKSNSLQDLEAVARDMAAKGEVVIQKGRVMKKGSAAPSSAPEASSVGSKRSKPIGFDQDASSQEKGRVKPIRFNK